MQCFRRAQGKVLNRKVLSTEFPNIAGLEAKCRNDIQTVIVGAGLAGLSAAHHLIKNGFERTIIVEATNRYGGRIDTKHFGDAFCELGAKWITIDSTQNSMYELLKQAENVQKRIESKQEIDYRNTKGEKISRHLPEVVEVYFKKLCAGLDLQDRFRKNQVHDLSNVQAYLQTEAQKITRTWFKEKDHTLVQSVFNTLMKEYGGKLGCNLELLNVEQLLKFRNQCSYPIYVPNGLDNIFQEITANISKENLQTGRPVGEICWFGPETDKRSRSVKCLDGTVLPADHIICTLPLGVLKSFATHIFKPALPPEKVKAIGNLGYGSPVKIYFEYRKSVKGWFPKNVRPLWMENESTDILEWIKQVVEITKLPGSNRVLEISIGGAYYYKIEKLPDSELITELTKLLRKCLSNRQVPYPKEVLRSHWNSSACYLGGRPYFSLNSSVQDVHVLATPLGFKPTLLFAGDATSLQGFGTLDGARTSGIREAQRIIEYYNRISTSTIEKQQPQNF